MCVIRFLAVFLTLKPQSFCHNIKWKLDAVAHACPRLVLQIQVLPGLHDKTLFQNLKCKAKIVFIISSRKRLRVGTAKRLYPLQELHECIPKDRV